MSILFTAITADFTPVLQNRDRLPFPTPFQRKTAVIDRLKPLKEFFVENYNKSFS